jgi:DNA polymerase-3 subunit epsilon/oligoribonuclease
MLAVFLDTETSGLNPIDHKIFEIAYQMVDLSSGKLVSEYQTLIAQPLEAWKQSDAESLRVTGFTWEEIASGKQVAQVTAEILKDFAYHGIQRKKAVFICQNPTFDRAFFSQLVSPEMQEHLRWPYHWLDLASMYWALSIRQAKTEGSPLPWQTGISKDNIATRYNLPHEPHPHRAMNGVKHLVLCYKAVVGY